MSSLSSILTVPYFSRAGAQVAGELFEVTAALHQNILGAQKKDFRAGFVNDGDASPADSIPHHPHEIDFLLDKSAIDWSLVAEAMNRVVSGQNIANFPSPEKRFLAKIRQTVFMAASEITDLKSKPESPFLTIKQKTSNREHHIEVSSSASALLPFLGYFGIYGIINPYKLDCLNQLGFGAFAALFTVLSGPEKMVESWKPFSGLASVSLIKELPRNSAWILHWGLPPLKEDKKSAAHTTGDQDWSDWAGL
jgi:hypothetical protein